MMHKKHTLQTMTFPGCGLCMCVCVFVLCCWVVLDVGRCILHWMEELWDRAERKESRAAQLCRASATGAETTEEEETLFPLERGVSSFTWKSLLEGESHLCNMVNTTRVFLFQMIVQFGNDFCTQMISFPPFIKVVWENQLPTPWFIWWLCKVDFSNLAHSKEGLMSAGDNRDRLVYAWVDEINWTA